MPFGNSVGGTCKECDLEFSHLKKLSEHIKKVHKISPIDYITKHNHAGVRPACLSCGVEPRFVSLNEGFKRYCVGCRKIAESVGGKTSVKVKNKLNVSKVEVKETMEKIIKTTETAPSIDVGSNELIEYVRSLNIEGTEFRSPVPVKGIIVDVWVPSKNVAIEHVSLSLDAGPRTFDKQIRRKAYTTAKTANIRLMQFFGDEWVKHNDTCKSLITNALGANAIKLHARECTIRKVTVKETAPFLQVNHISGSTRAGYHYVLEHPEHGIIGALTLRRPIQKKHGEGLLELARLAFSHGISCRGGASKLLSYVENEVRSQCTGLLSYAELRFGEGGVYDRCGFIRQLDSVTNYWYSDGMIRHDRFKFRAQPGKSEKIVTEEANVKAVYGAGNAIYLKKW